MAPAHLHVLHTTPRPGGGPLGGLCRCLLPQLRAGPPRPGPASGWAQPRPKTCTTPGTRAGQSLVAGQLGQGGGSRPPHQGLCFSSMFLLPTRQSPNLGTECWFRPGRAEEDHVPQAPALGHWRKQSWGFLLPLQAKEQGGRRVGLLQPSLDQAWLLRPSTEAPGPRKPRPQQGAHLHTPPATALAQGQGREGGQRGAALQACPGGRWGARLPVTRIRGRTAQGSAGDVPDADTRAPATQPSWEKHTPRGAVGTRGR